MAQRANIETSRTTHLGRLIGREVTLDGKDLLTSTFFTLSVLSSLDQIRRVESFQFKDVRHGAFMNMPAFAGAALLVTVTKVLGGAKGMRLIAMAFTHIKEIHGWAVSAWRKNWALGFAAVFLLILLANTLGGQFNTLVLGYSSTVVKEPEPFMVTAVLRNTAGESQTYSVRMLVDGVQVISSESTLDALSRQIFTYTRASPMLGTAVRIYAEATNLDTGAVYSSAILVPQSPPETWMSFAAFSSFAMSLSSSSSSSSSLMASSISYYRSVMDIYPGSSISPVNVGLTLSITLIGLLIFLELTNPSYGRLGRRLTQLRSWYGLLAVSLFLVFAGTLLTRVVMIIG